MTIDRAELRGDRITGVTTVMPGFEERLSPSAWINSRKSSTSSWHEGWEQTFIKIETDDDIIIMRRRINVLGEILEGPKEVTLSKLAINDHHVQSDRGFFGRRVLYQWRPSVRYIGPEQELAIQELIEKRVLTKETAQGMREQIMYEAQQKTRLLPGKRLK